MLLKLEQELGKGKGSLLHNLLMGVVFREMCGILLFDALASWAHAPHVPHSRTMGQTNVHEPQSSLYQSILWEVCSRSYLWETFGVIQKPFRKSVITIACFDHHFWRGVGYLNVGKFKCWWQFLNHFKTYECYDLTLCFIITISLNASMTLCVILWVGIVRDNITHMFVFSIVTSLF